MPERRRHPLEMFVVGGAVIGAILAFSVPGPTTECPSSSWRWTPALVSVTCAVGCLALPARRNWHDGDGDEDWLEPHRNASSKIGLAVALSAALLSIGAAMGDSCIGYDWARPTIFGYRDCHS